MTSRIDAPSLQRSSDSSWINGIAFLLPFCIGLFIVFWLPQFGIASKFGGIGHDGYLELATSLYQGTGYRFSADGQAVFHRPPLYPVLLMPFMGLPQEGIKFSVVLLNSLFLLTACIYTRRICKLLFPQPAVGTIAVALLLCNPWVYRLVSSPLSAIMQMALYAALCFYFLQFCANYKQYSQLPARQLAPSFLKISLLTTAMCLAHGTSVYVCSALMSIAALAMLMNRQWKLLAFLLLTSSLTLIALSPWGTRNQAILDRVELSSSGAGFTYFLGNIYWGIDEGDYRPDLSTEMNALRMGQIQDTDEQMVDYWGVLNPGADNQLRDAMVSHILQNPSDIATKSLLNLADIYFPITHALFCKAGGHSQYCAESLNTYQLFNRASRTLLMLLIVGLALYTLRAQRSPRPELLWLALVAGVLHTLPYLPIATYAHHGIYSLGALPLICSLAAASLYKLRVDKAVRTPLENPRLVWGKPEDKALSEARAQEIKQQTSQTLIEQRDHRGTKVDLHLG